jgi:hypothetical protein
MRRFFHDLFTGTDNDTYDIGRVLWFQSIQAFMILSGYALYQGWEFDPIAWGGGLAALLGGGGAAIGLKASTEPKPISAESYADEIENLRETEDRLQRMQTARLQKIERMARRKGIVPEPEFDNPLDNPDYLKPKDGDRPRPGDDP